MNESTKAPELRRVMGFADLVLFFVITGFGIMWVAKAAEAGPLGITFWLISGIVFYLPLAVSVLALSAQFPGEGGLYVWIRETYGEFAGFISAWCYWAANLPYLCSVLYFIAGSALSIGGDRWKFLESDSLYYILVSLGCLALATVLNVIGLDVGKWLHNVGALGTWLPAIVLIALASAAWLYKGSVSDLSSEKFVPPLGFQQALFWSVIVMSLTGLEAAGIMGGEIRDERRWMAPALIIGAVLVIVTNIAGTLAAVVSIPAEKIAGSRGFMQAIEEASSRCGISGWTSIVAVLVVIGHLGKVGAWSATGARLPFVAGLGGRLPTVFAQLHPRWKTPYIALIIQAAIVAVLTVLGQAGTNTKGAYDVFLSMTLIPTFIPFLFLFAAAMRIRKRTRSPTGLAVLAVMGFTTTLASSILAVVPAADEANQYLYVTKVIGLAIVLVGVGAGIYLLSNRGKA